MTDNDSLAKIGSSFRLGSYLRSVRRAVVSAHKAEKARSDVITTFFRHFYEVIPPGVRRARFAQAGIRGLTRTNRAVSERTVLALKIVSTRLFRQRRAIRALMTRVISDRSDAKDWVKAQRYLILSQRLIDRQIPVVSGRILQVLHFILITMLTAQMASGNQSNTMFLARLINLTFRLHINEKRFPTAFFYFQALLHTRQYERIARDFHHDEIIENHYLAHIVGVANLYCNRPEAAKHFLDQAFAINPNSHADHRMLGRTHLLLGDLAEAAKWFKRAVSLAPSTVMAHQNYAGRYDIQKYKPETWELRRAGALLIYDNFGQLAEDFFLLGNFEASFQCYQKMLDFQKRWKRQHPLPRTLLAMLESASPNFDPNKPTRLLPYEWVTQFGHVGLLDSYLKMAKLGMYPDANYVLLAPEDKVVNEHYLSYWDDHFVIVRDERLVAALFPYQRILGDNFMAYPADGGSAEPWTRAAARAQSAWSDRKLGPLISLSDGDRVLGEEALESLGVPKGGWYVGLHVREAGYYGESTGSISTHRNSRIEDYYPALAEIVRRGGMVIRLGDKSMRPLPKMDGIVDYAHSDLKSPSLDIFFCATSRFVVGTTSGLTTACLSFGTPMVLVNCISNDWQLWTGDTDFIVKPVRDVRAKRDLTFAETYSMPTQGYLINSQVMRRHGLEAMANTQEEITEAVVYKLDMMDGRCSREEGDSDPAMKTYRTAIRDNPFMFAAARPALPFLRRHSHLLARNDSSEAAPDRPMPLHASLP